MRRVLFVAEKNDVAKGVATILSKGTCNRREGKSKYNKIYSLKYNILGQECLLSITSVSGEHFVHCHCCCAGHLLNVDFGPEMRDWQNAPMGRLFDAPLFTRVPESMRPIAQTLK